MTPEAIRYTDGTIRACKQSERRPVQHMVGDHVFGGACEGEARDRARLHERRVAERGGR